MHRHIAHDKGQQPRMTYMYICMNKMIKLEHKVGVALGIMEEGGGTGGGHLQVASRRKGLNKMEEQDGRKELFGVEISPQRQLRATLGEFEGEGGRREMRGWQGGNEGAREGAVERVVAPKYLEKGQGVGLWWGCCLVIW